MKRIYVAAVLLLLFFLPLMSACGTEDERTIRIGILSYQEKDPFIFNIVNDFNRIANRYADEHHMNILVDSLGSNGNQSLQNRQVNKFVRYRYDVILVNMVDRRSCGSIISEVAKAGIPIIFFNREPVRDDLYSYDKAYYVGSDPEQSVRIQADIIRRNMKRIDTNGDGIIQYAMLEGEPGHQDTEIRTTRVIRDLNANGIETEKIHGAVANWNEAQAKTIAAEWFRTYASHPFELVISNNDAMALGARAAYDEAVKNGLQAEVRFVGIDGLDEAIRAVDEGRMIGTVISDSEAYADVMFRATISLYENGRLSGSIPGLQGRYLWIPFRPYEQKQ